MIIIYPCLVKNILNFLIISFSASDESTDGISKDRKAGSISSSGSEGTGNNCRTDHITALYSF